MSATQPVSEKQAQQSIKDIFGDKMAEIYSLFMALLLAGHFEKAMKLIAQMSTELSIEQMKNLSYHAARFTITVSKFEDFLKQVGHEYLLKNCNTAQRDQLSQDFFDGLRQKLFFEQKNFKPYKEKLRAIFPLIIPLIRESETKSRILYHVMGDLGSMGELDLALEIYKSAGGLVTG